MTYVIRGARESDLPHLADNLRAADLRELVATYGHPRALEGLSKSLSASSECMVAADENDKAFVIWGISQMNHELALIWCVATPEVSNWRVPFVRESRGVIAGWFKTRPSLLYLINTSHHENKLHHRWLRSVGAELLPEIPLGPRSSLFNPFIIRRYPNV